MGMGGTPMNRSEETARVRSLRKHNVLDTPAEREFDDLVALATQICEAPIGGITMLDDERQWFKARIGLAVPETHRSLAFCHYTVAGSDAFEVEDALSDPRFSTNALVTGPPHLRFYSGVPIFSIEGYKVASIWVGDRVVRGLTGEQRVALQRLAHQVEALLRLKFYLAELHAAIQSRDATLEKVRALERMMEN